MRTFFADLLVASPHLSSSTRVKHRTAQRFTVSSRWRHWKPEENHFHDVICNQRFWLVRSTSWGQLLTRMHASAQTLLRRDWFRDYILCYLIIAVEQLSVCLSQAASSCLTYGNPHNQGSTIAPASLVPRLSPRSWSIYIGPIRIGPKKNELWTLNYLDRGSSRCSHAGAENCRKDRGLMLYI